ncbi:MAG: sialate O-acetylesterase [Pirellulales bacterium]
MKFFFLVLGVLIFSPISVFADVRLPRLFADNMVLQQDTHNAIWGWATPQETVTVSASWGASASSMANADGFWKVFLKTPSHGVGHGITVSGEVQAKENIHIQNVAVGEVWLCAGQSNMGWSVGNSFESEKEANVNLPHFRIFKSQREHWHEPLLESRDRLQQWKPCTQQSAFETSAVSYWFGKTLHQKLGVPVGIIVQAYAGTPIEGWMPWNIQKDDPRAVEHRLAIDRVAQRRIERGETVQKALALFEKELDLYNQKITAGETMKNQFRVLQPPFITKPASLGHQYPAHIFNAMIHPVRPYGIRGMIWYQGERNSKNVPQAAHYREQLGTLIQYYRSTWSTLSNGNVSADFPFQCTQLPSWNPAQVQPVEGLEAPWAVNRESMRLVSSEGQNIGMVTSIDTGDAVELHPKNKKPIGIRHALLAMHQTYRKDIVEQGPEYVGYRIPGNGTVVIDFRSVGAGLRAARQSEPLNAFAVAGENKKWFWADAVLDGHTVVVSSGKVPKPVAVRYAWAMNPSQRNLLYNQQGLPASPFRTDAWPLWEEGDSIIEVHKPEKPDGYKAVDWDRPVMTQAVGE